MDHRAEFDRLFRLQFSDTVELALRLFGTLIGSVFIHLHAGWTIAWIWPGAFILMHLVQYLHYHRFQSRGRRWNLILAIGLSFLSLISFVWMPALMILGEDEVLRISGSAIMGSLLIYLVMTADRLRSVIWGQVTIMLLVVVAIFWEVFPKHPEFYGRAGMAYAAGTMVLYLAVCLFTARRRRQKSETAAERSAQAQKLEAVGQLAGGVAHDFNNLLTAVIGNLDLSDEVIDPNEKREYVQNARLAARRAEKVVQQLLTFSRRAPHDPKIWSASILLDEARKLEQLFVPKTGRLTVHSASALHHVLADETQFVTAFINLILNAYDSMDGQGTVEVTVEKIVFSKPYTTRHGSDIPAGDYVAFQVKDRGPGISPEVLSRVLDPFFTTKPSGKGTGLGLSTVSGFAERSGGMLLLESSPKGTCASIVVPAAQPIDSMPEAQQPALVTKTPGIKPRYAP